MIKIKGQVTCDHPECKVSADVDLYFELIKTDLGYDEDGHHRGEGEISVSKIAVETLPDSWCEYIPRAFRQHEKLYFCPQHQDSWSRKY